MFAFAVRRNDVSAERAHENLTVAHQAVADFPQRWKTPMSLFSISAGIFKKESFVTDGGEFGLPIVRCMTQKPTLYGR